VLRVRVAREERHVWRLHLEAGNFAAALSYCSPTDMAQRDSVLTAQADHVFKEGQYELAATQFAKTKQPVEDVAIKFAVASQGGALKTFLLHKLDSVEESDTAQLTMLCIWLTDIYLHILSSSANDVDAQELTTLEFREFLTDKHRCLHRATTYSLIAAHGRIRESLHFALVCSDWERALSLHIQLHQPEAALALLSDMLRGVSNSGLSILDSPLSSGAQVDEAQRLFEKFSPQLILLAPAQLVDVWLQAPKVEPAKLLPAIMSYEQRYEQGLEVLEHGRSAEEAGGHGKRTHHGIRYLQYCVDVMGCDDQAVCNCLLLLHIKHSEDAQLCDFLSGIRLAPDDTFAALGADAVLEADRSLRAAADDAAVTALAFGAGLRMLEPAYDPDYALRLCQEACRVRTASPNLGPLRHRTHAANLSHCKWVAFSVRPAQGICCHLSMSWDVC